MLASLSTIGHVAFLNFFELQFVAECGTFLLLLIEIYGYKAISSHLTSSVDHLPNNNMLLALFDILLNRMKIN